MKFETLNGLSETWYPKPTATPVDRILEKEGKNLSKEFESVEPFSLRPTYSKKQLRKIDRMRMNISHNEWKQKISKHLVMGGLN